MSSRGNPIQRARCPRKREKTNKKVPTPRPDAGGQGGTVFSPHDPPSGGCNPPRKCPSAERVTGCTYRPPLAKRSFLLRRRDCGGGRCSLERMRREGFGCRRA